MNREKGKEETSSRGKKMKKVRFKVKAAPGNEVLLAGTFNNWNPTANKMTPSGQGYYAAVVALPAGRYEYKYVIDGAWCLDNTCDQTVPNAFGTLNNVIEIC